MNPTLALVIAATASFLIGAIPFGYLIGRIVKGVDIREHGSKNVGATNVFRVVGRGAGLVALALDIAKGFAPVFATRFLPGDPALAAVICAGAAIAGHVWTPYLRMRGGKGVATSCGAVLAITPAGLGLALATWIAVVAVTRYISLGSMVAAVVLVAYILLSGSEAPLVVFAVVVAGLIIVRHRGNIRRLLGGTENRFSLSRRKD